MQQLMTYKIISGKTVEERKALMSGSRSKEKKRRGQRVKGGSSLAKIKQNEREAVKNLARVINCNFGAGDLWLTLTYGPERLPADIAAAKKDLSRFMRNVRRRFLAEHGRGPRYVISTSQKDPDTGERVRIHHHIVMERAAYDTICQLWPQEDITYRLMDGRGDYTGIARYIISQAEKGPDAKKWSVSRGNMAKPIYTEPVPVKATDPLDVPAGAVIREKYSLADEETGAYTEYVRYTVPGRAAPKKPKDRKPKKKKRKTRQHKKR
jgi:hypothetical protein